MTRALIPLLLVLTISVTPTKWLLAQSPAIDLDKLLWAIGEAETGDYPEEVRECIPNDYGTARGRYQVKITTALDLRARGQWVGNIDLCHPATNAELARLHLLACYTVLKNALGRVPRDTRKNRDRLAWCYFQGTLIPPRGGRYLRIVRAHYEGEHIELARR